MSRRRGAGRAPKKRQQVATVGQAERHTREVLIAQASHYSGPLPQPEVLVKYDAAFPGCSQRIVTMAEGQATHRQALEARVVESNCRIQEHGTTWAGVVMIIAMVGGFTMMALGKSAEGITAILSSSAAIGGSFLYAKRQQTRERIAKERAFAESAPRGTGRPA